MPSRDGREQWGGWLPVEVIQAAKEADEPMWKVFSEATRMYMGLDGDATLDGYERREAQLEKERDRIQDQIIDLERSLADKEDRLEEVRQNKEEYLDRVSRYEAHLDEVLDWLVESSGTTVYGKREALQEAAMVEYGKTTSDAIEEVISDLRARSDERELPLTNQRFTEGTVMGPSPAAADGGSEAPTFKLLENSAGGDDGAE